MVTYDDVVDAAKQIEGVARRTPIMTSRTLDERLDARVYLKCESFQRSGAFKFRGAYNALSRFTVVECQRGVVTHSSGNHAQALALAGQLVGTSVVVVMPRDAPASKRRAAEGYGARVVEYDPATAKREDISREIQEREDRILVPPFDHPHIIAGQGTVALELIEEIGPLDLLLTPCGGGGLLSGCALATRYLSPDSRIVGVEPEAGDDATRSFKTGALQTVSNPRTIADGARTASMSERTFSLVRQNVDDMVTVSDADLVQALRFVWERLKLVVEPTGVLGLAAALTGKVEIAGKRVGIVLSGGNVDLAALGTLLAPSS
ncbi:MAG TPA: threo-3-hydroxy-L-aspartate ammonia-lyase [Vicinamibacteria bacterium]